MMKSTIWEAVKWEHTFGVTKKMQTHPNCNRKRWVFLWLYTPENTPQMTSSRYHIQQPVPWCSGYHSRLWIWQPGFESRWDLYFFFQQYTKKGSTPLFSYFANLVGLKRTLNANASLRPYIWNPIYTLCPLGRTFFTGTPIVIEMNGQSYVRRSCRPTQHKLILVYYWLYTNICLQMKGHFWVFP